MTSANILPFLLAVSLLGQDRPDRRFAGPAELQDTFLPAQLRYQSYPESACLLPPAHSWQANLTLDWAAHLAQTDTYLFDGESVTTTLKLRYRPVTNWEVGLDVPYTDRIDGTLDRFIEYVENTLHQRVTNRFLLPRNTYQAYLGSQTQPEMLLHKGNGFSDLTLRAKHPLLDEYHGLSAAAVGTLTLPTGASTFGGRGVSPGLGLHLQRPVGPVNFFVGAAGNYYSDHQEQNFEFNAWRGMGYGGVELKPFGWLALVTEYQVYSPLAATNPPLDENTQYWSLTARVWFGRRTWFESGFVENSWFGLMENRNSSDVIFKFALTHRF